jgi:NAD/NADP transhydrogenase beta subunit
MALQKTSPQGLRQLERLSKLMDAQFKFPGTDFRFGLDGLLGLIPGAGDLSTFAVSGYMLWIMAHNGASSYVLARMVLNVLVDAIVGAIPFVGDIFDFAFKANMRNMRLMREHYQEGRHRGSAWRVIIPVLIVLFLIIAALIWLAWKLVAALF